MILALSDLANASNERRLQDIMRLRRLFDDQEVVSVSSAAKRFGYSEKTIIKWCVDGDIPLCYADGSTVVEVTVDNQPKWLGRG